jgi:hypothetical protein
MGIDMFLFCLLCQGALGEAKKDDKATMFVKVDDQKLAIGTLSNEKFPQIQFDLVFEKEFELSHTSKSSSVFFSGYKVFQPADGDEMDFDDSEDESEDEEEEIVPATKENGIHISLLQFIHSLAFLLHINLIFELWFFKAKLKQRARSQNKLRSLGLLPLRSQCQMQRLPWEKARKMMPVMMTRVMMMTAMMIRMEPWFLSLIL